MAGEMADSFSGPSRLTGHAWCTDLERATSIATSLAGSLHERLKTLLRELVLRMPGYSSQSVSAASSGVPSSVTTGTEHDLAALAAAVDGAASDLVSLGGFLRQSTESLRRSAAGNETFEAALAASALAPGSCAVPLEHLLVDLSDAYELLREAGWQPPEPETEPEDVEPTRTPLSASITPVPQLHHPVELSPGVRSRANGGLDGLEPQLFSRSTSKYWVPPASALRLKVDLARRLPVLVFGRPPAALGACGSASDSGDAVRSLVCGDALITSCYYDRRPDMPAYAARLARLEGSTLVRLRWYSPCSGGASPPSPRVSRGDSDGPTDGGDAIYVERKTHHEAASGLPSCKERFACRRKQVTKYLAGEWVPSRAAGKLAEEIRDEEIHGRGLAPVVRTAYVRVAFQAAASAACRVSLDACVVASPEPPSSSRAPRNWRSRALPGETTEFPYAILEVKLESGPMPAWLAALVAKPEFHKINAFSKYVHSAAVLLPAHVPTLPAWLIPLHHGDGGEGSSAGQPGAPRLARVIGPSGAVFQLRASASAPTAATAIGERAIGEIGPSPAATPLPPPVGDSVVINIDALLAGGGERSGRSSAGSNRAAVAGPPRTLPVVDAGGGHRAGLPPIAAQMYHGVSGSDGDDDGGGRSVTSKAKKRSPCLWMRPPQSWRLRRMSAAALAGGVGGGNATAALPLARAVAPGTSLDQATPTLWAATLAWATGKTQQEGGGWPWPAGKPNPQVKIEPKTFFANERTLLQWLSSSILVVFTALSLLTGSFSGGGGKSASSLSAGDAFDRNRSAAIVGAILAPVGIAFMAYALYTYLWRVSMIARRQLVRYDDRAGPAVLTIGLLSATVAGYIIIIRSYEW